MSFESGFDLWNPSDIFQNELAMAADYLVRVRSETELGENLDPTAFFMAVGEICQEFYDLYAPDHSIDNLAMIEIMEGVRLAVTYVRRGRPQIHDTSLLI